MKIYEVYDGARCRKFTEKEFEREKKIREKKGDGFFEIFFVSDEDAARLGDNPHVRDVRDCDIKEA